MKCLFKMQNEEMFVPSTPVAYAQKAQKVTKPDIIYCFIKQEGDKSLKEAKHFSCHCVDLFISLREDVFLAVLLFEAKVAFLKLLLAGFSSRSDPARFSSPLHSCLKMSRLAIAGTLCWQCLLFLQMKHFELSLSHFLLLSKKCFHTSLLIVF